MSRPPRARAALLCHPAVVVALGVWLLNDHVFKAIAPSALTGIASDAAGLVAFPAILVASCPRALARHVGVPRLAWACALATAAVFAAINVSPAIATPIGVVLSALPRIFALVSDGNVSAFAAPTAHVGDLADLAALPFACVTPWLVSPPRSARARLRVAGLLTLVALAPGPVRAQPAATPAERARAPITLRGGVAAGAGRFDEPLERGRHAYVLGGFSFALEGGVRRARFGGFATVMRGWLADAPDGYAQYGVVHPRYGGFSVGLWGGVTSPRLRLEIGAMLARFVDEDGPATGPRPSAYARCTLTRWARVGLTFQAGSRDGFLLDGRLSDVGMVVERPRVRARLGVGLGMSLAPDIAASPSWDDGLRIRGRRSFSSGRSEPVGIDIVGDVELAFALGRGVWLETWLQAGTQMPRGRLGLAVEL